MERKEGFFQTVYRFVKEIPKGKVATYGMIATLAGNPRMSRQVGWALHANPNAQEIPCHRVVNRFGMLADSYVFGGKDVQKMRLEAEGVEVDSSGKVDLNRFLWKRETL